MMMDGIRCRVLMRYKVVEHVNAGRDGADHAVLGQHYDHDHSEYDKLDTPRCQNYHTPQYVAVSLWTRYSPLLMPGYFLTLPVVSSYVPGMASMKRSKLGLQKYAMLYLAG